MGKAEQVPEHGRVPSGGDSCHTSLRSRKCSERLPVVCVMEEGSIWEEQSAWVSVPDLGFLMSSVRPRL